VPRSFVHEWTFIAALDRQWALDNLDAADTLGSITFPGLPHRSDTTPAPGPVTPSPALHIRKSQFSLQFGLCGEPCHGV
jgi:hypothetical protein